MADGKGCKCEAKSAGECGCPNVDWTPKELVEARREINALKDLVRHLWKCEGFYELGYEHMDVKMRKTLCRIVGLSYRHYNRERVPHD